MRRETAGCAVLPARGGAVARISTRVAAQSCVSSGATPIHTSQPAPTCARARPAREESQRRVLPAAAVPDAVRWWSSMSGKGGSMQASLSSVYEMFRDEDGSGSGVSRSRCKAFLWATGHEVDDEDALDQIMMKYTGTGGSAGVANSMTKSQFVKFVQDAVAVDYGAGDVEESFIELLPPGADTISVARLKSLLAQHGEQMPVDDIDQLIAHVDPAGTGVVSFEQFKEIFQ